MDPIPPISRRERALRGVVPVERPRLLSPAEREEARRERERKRKRKRQERERAQDRPGGADHRA
jgi:hypothetical protein